VIFQSHFGLISTHPAGSVLLLSGYFQSHFGLISTLLDFDECGILKMLSIPFWSDFNDVTLRKVSNTETDFQSHFGLISTRRRSRPPRGGFFLSIPFWSDFNIHQQQLWLIR